mmetsp:Transcript_11259/g.10771  ORF Transcript_11259/g.10771 Transcript_11259/m.10771 type:complete len:222 (-) Transcript_11259:92-757(-)|eukprot:CAMPEP_0197835716 /NCGR_PEP_ID=MMETSP1437-20131217/26739_1 /TAXON_ID=49252 ORGANISM="Eucampia antarctica, Strain CCMP1452" /NCGR_SAMPLE_ID=MMETSP1437 /ASSEMBLY_ACC=CAM_ASM_001096 /LENGTH=221 /DNA_ID=CAMNT_0043441363 /DNA_START=51 /DNA_END=716 /DNA_ORIENTATION=-
MPTVPKLRFEAGSIIAPGDRIGSTRQIEAGSGTYIHGGNVYASAVGKLDVTTNIADDNNMEEEDGGQNRYVANVILEEGRHYASSQVLLVGQVVLGKVLRITTQQVTLEIVAADGIGTLRENHGGVVRKEDVRSGATEKVEMYASFRPGDIILARIISLGDSRSYYLSTAENELGVIRAISAKSGINMVPISWREMECPETKAKELRKCAKPKGSPDTLSS